MTASSFFIPHNTRVWPLTLSFSIGLDRRRRSLHLSLFVFVLLSVPLNLILCFISFALFSSSCLLCTFCLVGFMAYSPAFCSILLYFSLPSVC
jgi:hypothetical protein